MPSHPAAAPVVEPQALRRASAPEDDALEVVRAPLDALLAAFLADRTAELRDLDAALVPVADAVTALVASGGKRLRPAFVYWGHRATGAGHDAGVLPAAAAVELLHTFALIHDDVMDRSAVRRGVPAVHAALADAHRAERLAGDAGWFGVGGAILAGDLVFVWADEVLESSPLPRAALDRARRVFLRLRSEVMAGQYLDLRLAGDRAAREDDALRVALLKSGRYTVTRPLQMGAAIGGADDVLDAALSAYGDAVGLAFQVRDDVLGLFGDPTETGKTTLSDLREGKRTLLVLRTLAAAAPAERDVVEGALGDPDVDEATAARVREVVEATGALRSVEILLEQRHELALRALAPVPSPAREALEQLAGLAVVRIR